MCHKENYTSRMKICNWGTILQDSIHLCQLSCSSKTMKPKLVAKRYRVHCESNYVSPSRRPMAIYHFSKGGDVYSVLCKSLHINFQMSKAGS